MSIVEPWVFKHNLVMEQLASAMEKLKVSKRILALSGLSPVAAKEEL